MEGQHPGGKGGGGQRYTVAGVERHLERSGDRRVRSEVEECEGSSERKSFQGHEGLAGLQGQA